MRIGFFAACAVALLAPGPLLAQSADCGELKWSVAREQAAFAGESLPNIASGSALPGAGQAVVLKLVKQDAVSFPVAPRKPKRDSPLAGMFPLPAGMAAGTYQVTLSDEAWIEIAQNGKLLRQAGFTGSKTCPAVRKSVRFDLAAGPATLELSDAGTGTIKVEVLPKE